MFGDGESLQGRQRVLAAVLVVLCGCAAPKPVRIANDAYIWQRRWDASLLTAIREAAPVVRAWRVLAADDAVTVPVNWEALRQTGKPIIAVVRMKSLRDPGQWLANGIEIDYDCAQSRLPAYREFLRGLRGRIRKETALSITALPSWMESDELPGLLAEVDEAVLQVHSVMDAKKGLFARATAYEWAREWSKKGATPFRIALPTYWSRVSWDDDGQVVAIESEETRYGKSVSHELFVDPKDVSALMADLRRRPIKGLEGVAWFRLPTSEDQRAWSLATWRAVMEGRTLGRVTPEVRVKSEQTGVRDIYLRSEMDERLPAEVLVTSQGCEFADGLEPYTVERETNRVRFRLAGGEGVLRAGRERMVGWVRCTGKELDTNVSVE